ncbi:MAG: flagellar filament outer layer protein FlaA [Brevinemataceae bacterium]
MRKQKYFGLIVLLLCSFIPSFGQDQQTQNNQSAGTPAGTNALPIVPSDPNQEKIGFSATAGEEIKTFLLEDFELPQGWIASIPLDFGISKVLYKDGAPKEIASDTNKTMLGIKTIFFRRIFGWMSIDRPFPTILDKVVKNISVWVVGRNRRHTLFAKIRDITGNRMRVPAGQMNWQGWKNVVIPMTPPIVQFDAKANKRGLEFYGFHINFEAEDIVVNDPYYLYLDYVTASMNDASTQYENDVLDNW